MKIFILTLTGGTIFTGRSKRLRLGMSNIEFCCDLAQCCLDFCKVSSMEISGIEAEGVACLVP